MTEETNAENTQVDPLNQNGINITVEQILASILNQTGMITVALDDLIKNYGTQSISVTQNEDKSVNFELVATPVEQQPAE